MNKLKSWLSGKKTYIVAGAIALATVAGVFFGKVDFSQAAGLLGFAGAICGLGAKVDRHAAQMTALLTDVANAGGATIIHHYSAAGEYGVKAVEDAMKLAQQVKADRQ